MKPFNIWFVLRHLKENMLDGWAECEVFCDENRATTNLQLTSEVPTICSSDILSTAALGTVLYHESSYYYIANNMLPFFRRCRSSAINCMNAMSVNKLHIIFDIRAKTVTSFVFSNEDLGVEFGANNTAMSSPLPPVTPRELVLMSTSNRLALYNMQSSRLKLTWNIQSISNIEKNFCLIWVIQTMPDTLWVKKRSKIKQQYTSEGMGSTCFARHLSLNNLCGAHHSAYRCVGS